MADSGGEIEPPLIGSEAGVEVLWKTANELRVGVFGNR